MVDVIESLRRHFGHASFRPGQEALVRAVLDGRDVLAVMVSPSDVRIVHSIETDDPEGIEQYWHGRFAERRVKTKEVFRLTPDDIAAFKRRQYQ